jgi:hypothetical protein
MVGAPGDRGVDGAGYFGLVVEVTVQSQARKVTVCWTRNEREG